VDPEVLCLTCNFSEKNPVTDLTGLLWTKLCERLSLERSFGDAEEHWLAKMPE